MQGVDNANWRSKATMHLKRNMEGVSERKSSSSSLEDLSGITWIGHVFISQEEPRGAKKDQEGYPRLENGGINGKEVNWVFCYYIEKNKHMYLCCGGLESRLFVHMHTENSQDVTALSWQDKHI